MNTPKVSIIVPVYNSEKFLKDCLDSLLAQKFPSFEIICVNDGSTDGSVAILEDYSLKHPEIRVIHQPNSGVSAARNRGLSQAGGDYICFCDSDDCLLAGILAQAVQALECGGGELAFFEMKLVPESYRYRQEAAGSCPVTWGMQERILKNLYVFLLLISRDFLVSHHVNFHEKLRYSEDELFVLDLLRFADLQKICWLHGAGYFHRKNSGSVMNASKWYRAPRHYEAMQLFAAELRAQSAKEEIVRTELLRRTYQAVSNALYDGFFMEKPPKQILAELSEAGLYPYPLQWQILKPGKLKTTLSNYVRFLFPVRGYYLLMCRLVRQGMKIYKKE